MPETLTLFEHETTHGFGWTDADLSAIERLNGAFGTEVLRATVRGGRRELQARQHVGVIRLGRRTVQILPKMCRPATPQTARIQQADQRQASNIQASNIDEEVNARQGEQSGGRENLQILEATRNLLSLLGYARRLTIREHSLTTLTRQDADWLEVLTHLFATHLREEWKRGAIRRYQALSDDRTSLRGTWRIGDQICRPERKHIFSVTCDEFTADNPVNRILRFVVERLWLRTRSGENRQILSHLRGQMEDVTLPAAVSPSDADAGGLGRFEQAYRPLLGLARLFLESGALQMAAGEHETYAFVFDMNRLFEEFVAGFLARHGAEILPPGLADCRILPQTRGAARHLATRLGRPQFRLDPDIAFCQDGVFPLLIDTKYKRLSLSEAALGIGQADMYQMYAYARRYDCRRVLLLYPQTEVLAEPLRESFALEDGGVVHVATLDLRVPLSQASGRASLAAEIRQLMNEIIGNGIMEDFRETKDIDETRMTVNLRAGSAETRETNTPEDMRAGEVISIA